MREIRLHGSEGGGTELNRSFLPLSARGRCAQRWEVRRGGVADRIGLADMSVGAMAVQRCARKSVAAAWRSGC